MNNVLGIKAIKNCGRASSLSLSSLHEAQGQFDNEPFKLIKIALTELSSFISSQATQDTIVVRDARLRIQ